MTCVLTQIALQSISTSEDTMKWLLSKFPERFKWTLHNLVGHPLSEVFYQLGWERASDWAHEFTTPPYKKDKTEST